MKLQSPTIYVLHKMNGQWANSAFSFTGNVDRRRVKREIIRAFRRGGEVVHPSYIDASIDASLRKEQSTHDKILLGRKLVESVEDIYAAEKAYADDTGYPRVTGTSAGQHPAPLVGDALDKAVAGFAQQAKDNYEVSKEIQERDAAAKKNKNNGGRPR